MAYKQAIMEMSQDQSQVKQAQSLTLGPSADLMPDKMQVNPPH